MIAWKQWDAAHFREQDAEKTVMEAREAYKGSLRAASIASSQGSP